MSSEYSSGIPQISARSSSCEELLRFSVLTVI